jgi:hypothetical protein
MCEELLAAHVEPDICASTDPKHLFRVVGVAPLLETFVTCKQLTNQQYDVCGDFIKF